MQTVEKIENSSKCMYRKRKDFRKKRHIAAFVFVSSVFGEKFPTAEF
jgi:hypothetical protein